MTPHLTPTEEKTIWRRIDAARRYARDVYHPELKRAIELYDGKHYSGPSAKRQAPSAPGDMIVANKLKEAVEIKVAHLAFNLAEFFLVPTGAQYAEAMPVAKDALTFEWRERRMQAETKRSLRDCMIGGLGVCRTGWRFTTRDASGEEDRKSEGPRPPVLGEEPDTTPDEAVVGAWSLVPGPTNDQRPTTNDRAVDRLAIDEDDPFVERIPPLDWWTDPQADAVFENAAYCGYTQRVPLLDLKADPRLEGVSKLNGSYEENADLLDEADLEPNTAPSAVGAGPRARPELLSVQIHHYWEKRRKLHVIVAEETKEPLLVEPWPHEHRFYPFDVLRVAGWEDRCYPRPPLVEVEHQQLMINQQRTLLSMHQKASTPKVVSTVALTDANRAQLRSEKLMGIVELEEPTGEIRPLNLPGIPTEAFAAAETAERDIARNQGLDEYAAGAAPSKRVTEGEVAAIQQAAGARAQMERQDYEQFVGNLAAQVLSLLQQNSTFTRSLPIFDRATGEVAAFRDYTKEELQGDFIVSVYAGSTEAPNRQSKLRDFSMLMQSASGFAQALVAFQQIGLDLKPAFIAMLRDNFPELRNIPLQAQGPPAAGMPAPGMPGLPPEGGLPPDPTQMPPESAGDAGAPPLSPDILAALFGGDTGPPAPAA